MGRGPSEKRRSEMARKAMTGLLVLSLAVVFAGCGGRKKGDSLGDVISNAFGNAYGNAMDRAIADALPMTVAPAPPREIGVALEAAGEMTQIRIENPDGTPGERLTLVLDLAPALRRRIVEVNVARAGPVEPAYRVRAARRRLRITIHEPAIDLVELRFRDLPPGAHPIAIRSVRAVGPEGVPVPIVLEAAMAVVVAP
jgi:hypothetical protein